MADMKKIIIDGVEYEIIDASVRLRMTDAEANITDLQTGKADSADIPSNTSDLTNDAGFITEVPVEGVTIDETSIVSGKIAAIPRATDTMAGVVKIDPFTEEGTQYLDIYAEKDNGAEKENRVPLLDANNKILAAQLPAATTSTQGALSAEDKQQLSGLTNALFGKVDKEEGKGLSTIDYTQNDKVKLDSVEAGAQVNTVTGVKGNSESSYRTGNINLTAANIGAAASNHTHSTSNIFTNVRYEQGSITVPASGTKGVQIDISKSGYTPVAIGQWSTGDASVFIGSAYFYSNNTKAWLDIMNRTSVATTTNAVIYVLYIKDGTFS